MPFVEIHPQYRELLERQGVFAPEHFLELPAVIVSGHPDRHVARIGLGPSSAPISAYIKREHRVTWKDRLANAWDGYGFVSRSYREYQVVRRLHQAGIAGPGLVAAGEDRHGRAFVVLREATGCRDLRSYLKESSTVPACERLRLAKRLGVELARVHGAGFDHPDLYSKHLLVDAEGKVRILDWQRSQWHHQVNWRRRLRDLAALHATLAEELATPRERLACLRTYLRTLGGKLGTSWAARIICRKSSRLERRRRIREQCHPPLDTDTQNLVWLDGEALCVTREFQEQLPGAAPPWLKLPRQSGGAINHAIRVDTAVGSRGPVTLCRRWTHRPWLWLWSRLRGRRFTSPELEQAGTLFRLQRFGVRTAGLLAFGERVFRPWRRESFLLIESEPAAVPLTTWLAENPQPEDSRQRRQLLGQAADLVRRMHQAEYFLSSSVGSSHLLQIHPGPDGAAVVLCRPDLLTRRRRLKRWHAARDVQTMLRLLARCGCSHADQARFVRTYERSNDE